MEPRFVLDPSLADAHTESARLREAGPLVPVEIEGVRAWAATRYATLETVLTHPDLSREIRHWGLEGRRRLRPDGSLTRIVAVDTMLNSEGDAHRRLRGPLSRAFSPRNVAELRPRVEAVAARLIDHLATLPDAPADLRHEFTHPLPLEVIADLMGIPPDRRPELYEAGHVLTTTRDPDRIAAARVQRDGLLRDVIADRRRAPADDLISVLTGHEGERLTTREVLDTVEELFVAGHVTTVNLITNATRLLLTAPDQLALIRSGERPWSAAVEEALRLESPIRHFPMRYAVRDVRIDGVLVRKGEAVLACYASAGRDPDRYGDRAARFDVSAEPQPHLSFGHGPHFCLGAPLGRLQGEVALAALFGAFPDMTLAEPPEDLRGLNTFIAVSTRTLPVRLGRRAP